MSHNTQITSAMHHRCERIDDATQLNSKSLNSRDPVFNYDAIVLF